MLVSSLYAFLPIVSSTGLLSQPSLPPIEEIPSTAYTQNTPRAAY